jgi:hypothetical protein
MQGERLKAYHDSERDRSMALGGVIHDGKHCLHIETISMPPRARIRGKRHPSFGVLHIEGPLSQFRKMGLEPSSAHQFRVMVSFQCLRTAKSHIRGAPARRPRWDPRCSRSRGRHFFPSPSDVSACIAKFSNASRCPFSTFRACLALSGRAGTPFGRECRDIRSYPILSSGSTWRNAAFIRPMLTDHLRIVPTSPPPATCHTTPHLAPVPVVFNLSLDVSPG